MVIDVDAELWQIQRAIFPTYPSLPVTLDELERLLDEASVHDSIRTSVVDPMHESLIQFRDYANAAIQNVHHTMKESAGRGGYVFRYTSMDLVLLEQLGMERQDRAIRQQAVAPNSKMEELFEQFLALQIEEKQANLDRQQRVDDLNDLASTTTPTQINANTMAAAPITDEPKTYACEHCGEEVKLSGKGFHIGRHCKVLHPKGE